MSRDQATRRDVRAGSPSSLIPRPPCWPEGERLPNRCASRYYAQQVYGEFDLVGDWIGWKIRGDKITAPGGLKISKQALISFLQEQRRAQENPVPRVSDAATHPAPVASCSSCCDLRGALPVLQRLVLAAQSASLPAGSPADEALPPRPD